jgi:hypothetical protein
MMVDDDEKVVVVDDSVVVPEMDDDQKAEKILAEILHRVQSRWAVWDDARLQVSVAKRRGRRGERK